MTEITDRVSQDVYVDERRVGRVAVEIEATADWTGEPEEEALRAVRRVGRAVEAELQAIQDELDEDGEVHDA